MQVYYVNNFSVNEGFILKLKSVLREKGHALWYLEKTEERDYFQSVVSKLKNADVIFVEISEADANVGYQIAYSLSMNLPVFAFYDLHTKLSPIFENIGNGNREHLHLIPYQKELLGKVLEKTIVELSESSADKITIPLSPLIKKYLIWTSKKHNVSQSTYIRSLIEAKMLKDRDYRKEYL